MWIIKHYKIKYADSYLTKLIENGRKFTLFERANATPWDIYPASVLSVGTIGFFMQILYGFNDNKFYLQVLEYLHEYGYLEIDKDDHKKFYFHLQKNKRLFKDV